MFTSEKNPIIIINPQKKEKIPTCFKIAEGEQGPVLAFVVAEGLNGGYTSNPRQSIDIDFHQLTETPNWKTVQMIRYILLEIEFIWADT